MTDKPPDRALHGPWEMSKIRKAAQEDAVMQAISNGNCDCTVCQHRKSCASLGTDWKWQRYPTESQIRTRGSVSAVPIMSRPVWIFSDRG
jgi:hypothetical protein